MVVAEGEYHSSEPYYKIGRIPLGPNAAAVVVKSVSVETASIWRPTATCSRLAQAVGVKIAWPADKLILDDDIDLSNNGNTIGSEVIICCQFSSVMSEYISNENSVFFFCFSLLMLL